MKDLKDIEDIKLLVDHFYQKVVIDPVIGPIFKETIQFNWDIHIPIMYRFWESVLFSKATYKGNPMLVHIELNKKEKLTGAHFAKWMELWEKTIDESFSGDMAEKAKQKARMMKDLMIYKIDQSSNPNFIQ